MAQPKPKRKKYMCMSQVACDGDSTFREDSICDKCNQKLKARQKVPKLKATIDPEVKKAAHRKQARERKAAQKAELP